MFNIKIEHCQNCEDQVRHPLTDEQDLIERPLSVRKIRSVFGIVASVCHEEIFDFGQLLRT